MKFHSKNTQRGVTLVVSLMILVILTMLGLTSIQRATTDLAMAGNQREAALMFDAAEVGLTSAEGAIRNSTTNADYDDVDLGLYTVIANDTSYTGPDYFDGLTWLNSSQTATTSLNTYEQPRYMIEYMGDRSQNALAVINIGGYGAQQTGNTVSIYRSTSRGVGLSGNSARYLQAYFGKDAP